MATSDKITDNFLTCTMCTEVSGDLSTLECNHAVCQKCVIDYTKTRPETISEKVQLCPICYEMMKVSDPERPVEEWAEDVMPSSIIHRFPDSDTESENTTYCRYCKEEGETTPASCWCSVCDDALCERCVRMHNRNPSSRHHDVLDMPRELKVKIMGRELCTDHNDEHITLICRNCTKAVCQTCRITHHQKCEDVVETESEISALKSVLTSKQENLLRKREKMQMLVDKQKNASKEESERCMQIELGIKSASKKAMDLIKRKEKNLLNDLKNTSDKNTEQLKADIKSGEMSIQLYQQQAELIDQVLQSESDLDVYEMYRGYDADDVEDVEDADLKRRVARIMFRQDSYKLSQTLDDLQLGGIDVLYESVLDMKATPVFQDILTVRVGDTVEADPIDVTVLVVNGIDTVVVTDYENKSVKSFYTKDNQKCHSRLFLGQVGRPWCMAKVKHSQLAVTVLGISQIVTVEVNPDLVLLSTITTRKQYYGITSLTPSTLAAGSHSPPCIDILDVTGHVLSSISPLVNGYPVFKFPNFLFTTRTGDILVSDSGSRYVVCLTNKGDIVFTYSPSGNTSLKYPRGIASTISGDILVADSFLHRVIHLNDSGEFVRNIMTSQDGIQYPWGVCLDGCGCLYVCLSSEVKVYALH
ncbi:protein wech-like [Haliotis rubra]|uniref:protein wech-like n=1 Tax=Haliotis rubra TaxID=36100 RepID=UPI001EE611B8|nr:protein wech-like [Haliotis rubra]